jgi:hypothetical protein
MICRKYGAPISQFRLGSIVRKNDFATSYQAADTANGAMVTVEIVNRTRFSSPEEIKLFYNRARKLGSLEHPSIHLPDEISVTEGNSPFFVWTNSPGSGGVPSND